MSTRMQTRAEKPRQDKPVARAVSFRCVRFSLAFPALFRAQPAPATPIEGAISPTVGRLLRVAPTRRSQPMCRRACASSVCNRRHMRLPCVALCVVPCFDHISIAVSRLGECVRGVHLVWSGVVHFGRIMCICMEVKRHNV